MKNASLTLLCLAVALLASAACTSSEARREAAKNVDDVVHPEAGDDDAAAADATPGEPSAPDAVVAPGPPPIPTPGPDAPPVLESLAPWFAEGAWADALAVANGEAPAQAPALFDALALAHPDDPRALAARFEAAWLLADDNATDAAGRFEQLATDWPLMADIALLRAAELRADKDGAAALAALAKMPTDSLHQGRALALSTRVLAASAEGKAAARRALEDAAKKTPARLLAASWDELATLRDEAKDKAGAAAARYQLALRFPSDALGKAALKALDIAALDGDARLALGKALFDAGRYEALRGVLGTLKKPAEAACAGWILQGRAAERKKKEDDEALTKAFDFYKKALACEGDARADATFLGGRARIGTHPKEGKKLLQAHAKEFPQRSTADDALLLLAEAEKRPKAALKQLIATLKKYPQGDMADAVAWDLVGPHVEARNWKKVLETTDQVLAIAPDDVPGRHPGRYRYWRGRALFELGRADDAKAEWKTVFAAWPLSWYAVLSLSRLTALGDAPAAPRALDAPEPGRPEVGPPDLRVADALWRDVHFRRAVEWARLAGSAYDRPSPYLELIERELDAVGKDVRPDGDAWSWTRVQVQQLGGGFARSMRVARTIESSARLPFPVGTAAWPWRLAYPRPFSGDVMRWAKERELEPSWIWAVMRVESNFDPTAVSWANAFGLMQIILPTAKNLARDTDHEPTRENLLRPAVALELGTKYLQRLLGRHKLVPLASAGYNAGGGAVSKWRRQFGDVDVDEFVERIPYREAHLYAKSVTQTYARYRWLYDGELATLDLAPVGNGDAAAPPTE